MSSFKIRLSDIFRSSTISTIIYIIISTIFVNSEDSPNSITSTISRISTTTEECQVTPVIHMLQYPGCIPKPIPSFACTGRCSSYIQVSGSKIWQMERSCMCCQESGEREATVSLFCPKAKQGDKKFRKVVTKAPLECMCRPCTSVEETAIVPQEMSNFPNESPISGHFILPE